MRPASSWPTCPRQPRRNHQLVRLTRTVKNVFARRTPIAPIANDIPASVDGISSNTETFVVYFEAIPELTLSKSADRNIFSYEGQLIVYSFELTNTGNVPINSPFEPDDPALEEWVCPEEQTLGPGE